MHLNIQTYEHGATKNRDFYFSKGLRDCVGLRDFRQIALPGAKRPLLYPLHSHYAQYSQSLFWDSALIIASKLSRARARSQDISTAHYSYWVFPRERWFSCAGMRRHLIIYV